MDVMRVSVGSVNVPRCSSTVTLGCMGEDAGKPGWTSLTLMCPLTARRMNEPGFHGLVRHGWVETAAQTVKCGEEASGDQ